MIRKKLTYGGFVFWIAILALVTTTTYSLPLSQTNSTSKQILTAAGDYYSSNVSSQPFLLTKQINKNESWTFIDKILNLPDQIWSIRIDNLDCIAESCVIVGQWFDKNYQQLPLLLVSTDGGQSFIFEKDFARFPQNGYAILEDSKCSGTICVAVGESGDFDHSYPLILNSQNSGMTWKNIDSIYGMESLENSEIDRVTCQENICLAAGSLLILKSIDGGQTWTRITNVTGLPSNIKYSDVNEINCSKNTCVLAGTYHAYNDLDDDDRNFEHPFLLTSKDHGDSWNRVQKIGSTTTDTMLGAVYAAKCLDDGMTCLAGGSYNRDNNTLIFWKSINQGTTWIPIDKINTPDVLKYGGVFSISCTEKICLAAGGGLYIPLLLISNDYGASWTAINFIKNLPPYTYLTQARCLQNQCYAVGEYKTDWDSVKWLPLLLSSDDFGATWRFDTNIKHLPADIEGGVITAV